MEGLESFHLYLKFKSMDKHESKAAITTRKDEIKLYKALFDYVPKAIKETLLPIPDGLCLTRKF